MKQFVPITDDMLFDVTNFVGQLVPYQFGILCARQLRDGTLPLACANAVSAPPSEHHPV